MQLRDVLATELDSWTGVDVAWNDDDPWDDETFGADTPGSDDELEAVERWLEVNPLDDEPWAEGQEVGLDLLH